MTNEDAIALLKDIKNYYNNKTEDSYLGFGDEDNKALDMAIKALEQESYDDYISKTELLSRIDAERKHLLDLKMDGAEHIVVHHARRIIEDMPSVTPQPKVGEWIHPYKSDIACECSECHIQMPITNYFNYCPNCGAKMEVGE